MVIGVGLLSYPYIVKWYFNQKTSSFVEVQKNQIKNTDEDKLNSEFIKAEQYNRMIRSGQIYESTSLKYEDILNVNGSGVLGFVEIPKIKVKLPIFHGTSEDALNNGAGHIQGTTFPIGEKSSNAVITAHTGSPRQKFFTDLTKVKKGNYFYIDVLNKDMCYKVVSKKIILPENIKYLDYEEGKDRVTLYTCYPYGVNTHRLVIVGERSEFPQKRNKIKKNEQKFNFVYVIAFIWIILIGVRKWKQKK